MSNATRLRAKRFALDLTQRALADRLGVRENTVWRWENDPTSPPPLMALLSIDHLTCLSKPRPHGRPRVRGVKKVEHDPVDADA